MQLGGLGVPQLRGVHVTIASRRLAASLALALPATLIPVSVAGATAVAAASTTSTPSTTAVAAGTQPSVVATYRTKPGDWRWHDYLRQQPVWKTSTCSTATLATAKQTLPPKSGLQVQCAVVRTPLSWSDLSKGSMKLGMTRLVPAPSSSTSGAKGSGAKAAGASRTHPARRLLLVNPGGPGGEAGPLVTAMAAKPALLTTHQVVGVDPRGTGLSQALQCPPQTYTVQDPRVDPAKAWTATAASMKAFVSGCVKAQGTYLPHITTRNTVHDMDFARRLLGYQSTDWYGVSGGTWMGAWFAQLHPKTLGRVVLDANTQFTTDWQTSFASFPMGFARRYTKQFLPWAARANTTYKLGTTASAVQATYDKIRAAAGRGKVKDLTPATLDLVTLTMMYQDETFPVWAGLLSDINAQLAAKGSAVPPIPQEMIQQPLDTSSTVVRTAILCNDTPWPRGEASYRKVFLENTAKYPMFAYLHTTFTGVCAYWPYQAASAPTIDGSGTPKMLMVQTELDPATPLEGARKAHQANQSTRLLFVDNQGSHGAYLTKNQCVDKAVTAYLGRGTLPDHDVTCPGIPLPGEKKVYEVSTD